MLSTENKTHKIILLIIGSFVLVSGIILFIIPPALFPDPGMGFQVLRSMQLGSGFNVFISPDQSDISQNYTEFITWWSPGQYLVPYFFKLFAHLNIGQAIAITVTLSQFSGLAGFYLFFKKIGFSSKLSAFSIVFIVCQQAFAVPYVYYSGGEILLFAFEGWFLYGCVFFKKTDLALVLFVLLSGWAGFFFKSSFLWIYTAGIFCLWIRLSINDRAIWEWIRKGLWIAIPATISLVVVYVSYLSKGQSPASASSGIKLTWLTFGFPLAAPILSGFSVDDLFHGLIYHTGKAIVGPEWSIAVLILLAICSLFLIWGIVKYVQNENYRLFILTFYIISILFFGYSYLRQLTISMEARHFRIVGILIVPGMVYIVTKLKRLPVLLFSLIPLALAWVNFTYLVKGFNFNKNLSAKGITGISQPNIDQSSLNYIMKLDNENRNAVFVFVSNDIGLEITHNRIITIPPIGDGLNIDDEDYRYEGFSGPLYIVLPESYNGPKEKMIMKSFPGYTGFEISPLSDKYILYSAKMRSNFNSY